ncbi:hypothetical protein [Streptomyces sp. ITFR-6]|uniref:hypothetical protein n=1 Tax=Streptomyces sp. ITFR-6 TaxID=3075197 RepID=UPI00288B80AF|nr:hypothetical protein [Streptomyces sp. ITFR-6]WNI33365.1 hypothetical protein RLT59_34610 [Streptomyces sp. ITFR-6]
MRRSILVGATGTSRRFASVTASWKMRALPPPASTTIAPNSAAQAACRAVAGERQDVAAEMTFVGVAGNGVLLPLAPPVHHLGCEVFNLQAARTVVS